MITKRPSWFTASLLVLAALAAGGAGAAGPAAAWAGGLGTRDIIMPAEWAGIWRNTTELVDCETLVVLNSSTEDDTTCAGDVLSFESPENGYSCTESVNGNTVTVSCTATTPLEEGCDLLTQFDLTMTRSGDSFEGVQTIVSSTQGEGCTIPFSTCQRFEMSGTRIAPPPESCATAVETSSWSTIKSLYR